MIRSRAATPSASGLTGRPVEDAVGVAGSPPSTIELAASRSAVLGAAMLQRLDRHEPLLEAGARDLPARQQTPGSRPCGIDGEPGHLVDVRTGWRVHN
jgi:hypothetical protein